MKRRQLQLMEEPAPLWTVTRLIIGILYQMKWYKKSYSAHHYTHAWRVT